jgi:hypothetical protein
MFIDNERWAGERGRLLDVCWLLASTAAGAPAGSRG